MDLNRIEDFARESNRLYDQGIVAVYPDHLFSEDDRPWIQLQGNKFMEVVEKLEIQPEVKRVDLQVRHFYQAHFYHSEFRYFAVLDDEEGEALLNERTTSPISAAI